MIQSNEVLEADLQVPAHRLNADSDDAFKDMNAIYYYSGDSSESLLYTFFTYQDAQGQIARVARLMTCNYCGQLVNVDETKGEPVVPITWAKRGGGACRITSEPYRFDPFDGDSYESCLYWMDDSLNGYKLYTVFSEEKAVNFANSLSPAKQESDE